jgi:hypothetical protein
MYGIGNPIMYVDPTGHSVREQPKTCPDGTVVMPSGRCTDLVLEMNDEYLQQNIDWERLNKPGGYSSDGKPVPTGADLVKSYKFYRDTDGDWHDDEYFTIYDFYALGLMGETGGIPHNARRVFWQNLELTIGGNVIKQGAVNAWLYGDPGNSLTNIFNSLNSMRSVWNRYWDMADPNYEWIAESQGKWDFLITMAMRGLKGFDNDLINNIILNGWPDDLPVTWANISLYCNPVNGVNIGNALQGTQENEVFAHTLQNSGEGTDMIFLNHDQMNYWGAGKCRYGN